MKPSLPGNCLVPIALAISLIASPGWAQTDPRSAQELQQELARRDALISDLQKRVEALERTQRQAPATAAAPAPSPSTATGERSAARAAAVRPGDAASEDDVLSRALERSLVRSGGILLPSGQKEIEPALTYDYGRRSELGISTGILATEDFRRESYIASANFRMGLPWATQLELSVPYGHQRVETNIGPAASRMTDTGAGDVQIGLSKQLYADSEGRTGLIGNLTWQESTGRSNLGAIGNPAAGLLASLPSLGQGFDSLHVRLTGMRRMDPVVFLGSLSRSFNRAADAGGVTVRAGDTNSANFRAVLAASPDVSLRAGVSVARSANLRVNGSAIPGTRQTAALMELGGSVTLSPTTLLDVFVGTGLTRDTPDFIIGVSLPIRF